MMFKKTFIATLCALMLASPTVVHARKPLICDLIDYVNSKVTPMPIGDKEIDKATILASLEQVIQAISAINETIETIDDLEKFVADGAGIAKAIEQVKVTAIESVEQGTQTLVDAYKGAVADIKTANVSFIKPQQVQDAISSVAVVSDPASKVEEQAAKERKASFIQQAEIDLLADILVAKDKLADLKDSDSNAQASSASEDSNGNTDIVIRMKSFENEVQVLEQKLAAMRSVREGLVNLKVATPVKEKIQMGGV